jgi:peroxiredoxin
MKVLTFACTALLACFLSPLRAGEPIKDGVSPEAHQLIKTIGDFHTALKSASADLKLTVTQEVPGKPKRESSTKISFAAERPRLFKLRVEDEANGINIVSDGQTLWTYVPKLKQFMVDTPPMNFDILLRYHPPLLEAMTPLGPLSELFRKDPAALLLDSVGTMKIAGTEKAGGVDCIRLHGEQDNMDWDAWFEKGDKPVLRKYVYYPLKGMLANAPEEAKEQMKGVRMDVTVEYDNWKIDAPAAGAFSFQPPEGTQKVAQFFVPDPAGAPEPAGGGDNGGGGPAGGGAGPESLKGKPAPDFTLATLDGGKMHLADLKGKIVVLDFWATWCGPCVRALPMISSATAERKDKGVVFYAVNLQEESDEIKAFLKAQKLDVSVALDTKGETAKQYLVRGIPQSVIIGKDGNVAVVHIGFSPSLKDTLGKELDELLAK